MEGSATVVVSGGGTGIGLATAHRLFRDGRHVTIVGRREPVLTRAAREIGAGVSTVVADVGTPAGALQVLDQLAEASRACDAIVAAAGGLSGAEPDGLAGVREQWQRGFESNVLTAVLLVEALRAQVAANSGRVVLMSSVAGLRGSGGGPYGAMKAALHAYMFDLATELGPYGGTANVVAPGFVPDTEFWAGRLTDDLVRQRTGRTLLGRAGTTDEVAGTVAWLLGPDGGWVTGQIISPNGGTILGR